MLLEQRPHDLKQSKGGRDETLWISLPSYTMDKGHWLGPVREQRRLFQCRPAEPGNAAGRDYDLPV